MPILRIDAQSFDHRCAVCGRVRQGLPHSEAKMVENTLSDGDVVRVLVISCADCDSHESLNMQLPVEAEQVEDARASTHARHVRALLRYRGLPVKG